MSFTYKYERPGLTVDCVVFGLEEDQLQILLIERGNEPFKGQWAFPGGFVHVDETLEDAARRELQEEAGIKKVYLEQLYTFGTIDRDPRERIVSVSYFALVRPSSLELHASSDASDVRWFPMKSLPDLAFDHNHILDVAYQRLQGKVRYQPIGFELLPEKFKLTQLQKVYETLLDRPLDKRNFRKKILKTELLIELEEFETGGRSRPARLYRFDKKRYKKLEKQGFLFEV
jgi:8-oxo-dGTP diphosphatase